jgi:hypothetical protein
MYRLESILFRPFLFLIYALAVTAILPAVLVQAAILRVRAAWLAWKGEPDFEGHEEDYRGPH